MTWQANFPSFFHLVKMGLKNQPNAPGKDRLWDPDGGQRLYDKLVQSAARLSLLEFQKTGSASKMEFSFGRHGGVRIARRKPTGSGHVKCRVRRRAESRFEHFQKKCTSDQLDAAFNRNCHC